MKTLETILKVGILSLLNGCVEAPMGQYKDINLSPQYPTEQQDITCKAQKENTLVFDYYWFVEGEQVRSQTGKKGVLNRNYTTQGDLVECIVYTPKSSYSDSVFYGSKVTVVE
jgi:hypothetical protein